jgi:hypothetical protein
MLTEMKINGLAYEVSRRVPYVGTRFAREDDIKEAFYFSWDMTFGRQGEHRDHRTGGILRRKLGQVFANTFQGKLAEFAICEVLKEHGHSVSPDLTVAELGIWDSFDIQVAGINVSVKSTKRIGNLLLLETNDWTIDGEYTHHEGYGQCEAISLVRIHPSPEDLLKNARLLYSNSCQQRELKNAVAPLHQYEYQVVGAITPHDVATAIKAGHLIPQGATLNRRTTMDAPNYYVQACDFKDLLGFIPAV